MAVVEVPGGLRVCGGHRGLALPGRSGGGLATSQAELEQQAAVPSLPCLTQQQLRTHAMQGDPRTDRAPAMRQQAPTRIQRAIPEHTHTLIVGVLFVARGVRVLIGALGPGLGAIVLGKVKENLAKSWKDLWCRLLHQVSIHGVQVRRRGLARGDDQLDEGRQSSSPGASSHLGVIHGPHQSGHQPSSWTRERRPQMGVSAGSKRNCLEASFAMRVFLAGSHRLRARLDHGLRHVARECAHGGAQGSGHGGAGAAEDEEPGGGFARRCVRGVLEGRREQLAERPTGVLQEGQ
mmetsp:Transcript_80536/g.218271  ORF Transcript_80536/g.218271 Transcript_80536/m.218271 type:complete len:292 (+) Transcript_80536:525-1400(+)